MTPLFPRIVGTVPALLSAEECRAQCRVDGADEDNLLLGYAAAAQAWVEQFTGRWLTQRAAVAGADAWPPVCGWRVAAGPVVSVDGIDYVDAQGAVEVLPPEDYVLAERLGVAEIRLGSTVTPPARAADSRIGISLTIGYGAEEAPADLRVACLLLVGHYYRNREAVVVGAAPNELPLAVESLCVRHRQVVLA